MGVTIDSEQFMLIEHISGQLEQVQEYGINDEQWGQYQKITRGCKTHRDDI